MLRTQASHIQPGTLCQAAEGTFFGRIVDRQHTLSICRVGPVADGECSALKTSRGGHSSYDLQDTGFVNHSKSNRKVLLLQEYRVQKGCC